ncbi:hypothetical protein C7999DRAFT_14491 [Corynascus novoguineensis]|uniref:F-box domain-containing protein n=1 Tax=Corynascus novoguineensis TaxID=1126955 RepID=A0AAN7CSF5_9PEZI|nr:hypothetical protein C7999DRAFT_14491 [Corynascus novoguineensis]
MAPKINTSRPRRADKVSDPSPGVWPGEAAEEDHIRSSPLDALPAELRDQILLSIPDLKTLHSLVHACPVMYAHYRTNRTAILRACVSRDLDGFFADAYACAKSRFSALGSPRTNDKIVGFVEWYRHRLSSHALVEVDSISSDDLLWLANVHFTVMIPLARRYRNWALGNLIHETSSSNDRVVITTTAEKPDAECSRSEEIRIFRALYRYETYDNIFGRNEGRREGIIYPVGINDLFFGLFNPWEIEAIGCIELFVRYHYEEIFDSVKEDLHDRRRYSQSGPEKIAAPDYVMGTMSRGLRLTALLLAINNHETLVTEAQRCLAQINEDHYLDRTNDSIPIRRALEYSYDALRMDWWDTRDEAERRRRPPRFGGDKVPPDGPPLSWVRIWETVYGNTFGSYESNLNTSRKCGYVLWDEHRWNLTAKLWKGVPVFPRDG